MLYWNYKNSLRLGPFSKLDENKLSKNFQSKTDFHKKNDLAIDDAKSAQWIEQTNRG